MEALRIHVERIVRPIRAGGLRKNKMREELLAHLEQRVETARSEGMNDDDAVAFAIQNLGDPAALRAELQESVPRFERMVTVSLPLKGGADQWFDKRAGESAFRYAAIRTLYTCLCLAVILPIPVLLDDLPEWIAIVSGKTAAEPEWLLCHLVMPVAILIVNGLATFLMYVLIDRSGIRETLSRVSPAGVIRKSLAFVAFMGSYMFMLVAPTLWLASWIDPRASEQARWDGLVAVAGVLLPAVALSFVFGIPFIALMMTKEHAQYMRWGRLRIDE